MCLLRGLQSPPIERGVNLCHGFCFAQLQQWFCDLNPPPRFAQGCVVRSFLVEFSLRITSADKLVQYKFLLPVETIRSVVDSVTEKVGLLAVGLPRQSL